MQSWDSVAVNDETHQAHGRAGRVLSAVPFNDAAGVAVVEVQLDADTERAEETVTLAVSQLRSL